MLTQKPKLDLYEVRMVFTLCLPYTTDCWTAHKANHSSAKGPTGNSQYEPCTYFINVCWYLWCGGSQCLSKLQSRQSDQVGSCLHLFHTRQTTQTWQETRGREEHGMRKLRRSSVEYCTESKRKKGSNQERLHCQILIYCIFGMTKVKLNINNTRTCLFCLGKPNHVWKCIHLFSCPFSIWQKKYLWIIQKYF